jgi:CDP-diacylglycerol--inositol 3-phosphatidyltransferase
MITDRVSTLGLLIILSHLYPKYIFEFIVLIVLDISSHWLHIMSVTAHHKSNEALQHRNPILRWYYSIYPLFGYCCVGTECFYILLYINCHYNSDILENISFYICFPACVLKQIVNVIQLSSAAYAIASEDAKKLN